jgi:uncharacterized damage-inducible protein DinB
MHQHFRQMAAYARWANARLYAAALALPEDAYRRELGLFFGSLHGTLNHLVLTDRIWMGRLDGEEEVGPLDRILHADRHALVEARIATDVRLIALVDSFDEAALEGEIVYRNTRGDPFTQKLRDILAHLFNHQTHHRGQAHSALSLLTGEEPPSLDLLMMQRGVAAPDLDKLLAEA